MLVNRHRDLTSTPLKVCPNYTLNQFWHTLVACETLILTVDCESLETLTVSKNSHQSRRKTVRLLRFDSLGIHMYIQSGFLQKFYATPAIVAASEAPQTQLRYDMYIQVHMI